MNTKKNKRGISIMVGYVLLVSFAVFMGVIVYQWMKTFVPKEALECPEGTSLFIKDYTYNCSTKELDLVLTNNGRFNIGGYFIHATISPEQELATEDLSRFSHQDKVGNIIRFFSGSVDNPLRPNYEETHIFDLSNASFAQIYSIEIIPVRWQIEDNKKERVSCGESKIEEIIYCS